MLKKIMLVKCMLKVRLNPQINILFPFSWTAHERRMTRRNVSLVILKKGEVVNIFSDRGCSLREKIENSFHNVDLNVKIMVSRAPGAARVPSANKLLTRTFLPGEQKAAHFARRQHTAAQFYAPLNPRYKLTSCPKCITLLGILPFPLFLASK